METGKIASGIDSAVLTAELVCWFHLSVLLRTLAADTGNEF